MISLDEYIAKYENEVMTQEKYNNFKTELTRNNFLLRDDYFKLYISNKNNEMVQKLNITYSSEGVTISR